MIFFDCRIIAGRYPILVTFRVMRCRIEGCRLLAMTQDECGIRLKRVLDLGPSTQHPGSKHAKRFVLGLLTVSHEPGEMLDRCVPLLTAVVISTKVAICRVIRLEGPLSEKFRRILKAQLFSARSFVPGGRGLSAVGSLLTIG